MLTTVKLKWRLSSEYLWFAEKVQNVTMVQRMWGVEGVQVLNELGNGAVAMLFALVYALNLSYPPPEWKYTFKALQKLIMGVDGQRLSKKLQVLKTLLTH
ncbi:hypothetical protein XENORESO_004581 [Xenotaenia resolanae]|uniref:Uncharacterized protein n=1 Tax=Xenotaenia resolanae TaxID=208358 RepID=A0ABV0VVP9_9TELE